LISRSILGILETFHLQISVVASFIRLFPAVIAGTWKVCGNLIPLHEIASAAFGSLAMTKEAAQ